MQFDNQTLPIMIGSVEGFRRVFSDYVSAALWPARLIPRLSVPRIEEAHGSWKNDLARVEDREIHLNHGLDHFKQAGHLAFWVRRLSPLIETVDAVESESIQDAGAYGLDATGTAFRTLLLPYSNEYLAFDLGFQVVKYYETKRTDRPANSIPKNVVLGRDYYETICHFLKFKNVSPHALHLIYKSLYV